MNKFESLVESIAAGVTGEKQMINELGNYSPSNGPYVTEKPDANGESKWQRRGKATNAKMAKMTLACLEDYADPDNDSASPEEKEFAHELAELIQKNVVAAGGVLCQWKRDSYGSSY